MDEFQAIQRWKARGYEVMVYTTTYVEGNFYDGWICAICPPQEGGRIDHANRVFAAALDVLDAIRGALIAAARRWPEESR